MNIQRYDLEPGSESMQRFPDGDYVLHTDHLEAVKQASADALRWVLEQLDYKTPEYFSGGISSDVMNRVVSEVLESERSRLRAIIEKELSK